MEEYLSLKFDSNQMIRLLGVQLYDTPLAMLRENVQNAVDAIRMRMAKDKQFTPRVDVTISINNVSIEDNGIGMSADTLRNNYWYAGNSGKNTLEAKEAGVIGHFGIGALANFGVCTELELSTMLYGDHTRCYSKAIKAKLNEQSIVLTKSEDNSDKYGTKITATLEIPGSVTVDNAISYLRSYVRYLEIQVFVNGTLVSGQKMEVDYSRKNTTSAKGETIQRNSSFKYELSYNNYQPIGLQIKVTDVIIGGIPMRGQVFLATNTNESGIMGIYNGFGLANINLVTNFNFSGVMDFSFLEPTAGREAISRESTRTAQLLLHDIEELWASVIASSPIADSYRDFLFYLQNHFSLKNAANVTVRLVNRMKNEIKMSEIDEPQNFIYYAGQDEATKNSYSSSNSTLLWLHPDNPKRKVQRMCMSALGVEEIGNKVEIRKVYSFSELDTDEAIILGEIRRTIEDDYIISDVEVVFAEITMTVQYHTQLKDRGFIIYIQRNTPDVQNIKSIYKDSYNLFTPLVKDFVRTSLYNLFAGFIPTDKKTRAAYINRVFNDKRETYTLSPTDYGELNDVYERIKDDQMDVDQFLNYVLEKNSTRQKQTVDETDVGDVEKVVSTAGMTSEQKENEQIPKKAPDALVAQPPILEMDNDTEKKLLFTNVVSPVLHGNQMFLALSDKMDRFNRPFFLLPHTTRVIWSMHRIIYIFTDITSSVSFYYELELDKKLDEANTGGEPILSTTIVTKHKIFVPVMPQLYDYFKQSQREELSFMVNYTKVP